MTEQALSPLLQELYCLWGNPMLSLSKHLIVLLLRREGNSSYNESNFLIGAHIRSVTHPYVSNSLLEYSLMCSVWCKDRSLEKCIKSL